MQFVKTTLVGGLTVLMPVAFLVWMVGKVFRSVGKIAAPLAEQLEAETVAGFLVVDLITVIAIVVFCFITGLLARSRFLSDAIDSLEAQVLHAIPGYNFLKGMTGSVTSEPGDGPLAPVLVRCDDNAQLAFRVETLADGRTVVYAPGAPDPWSGAILVVDSERVEELDATMASAVRTIRGLGRGLDALLAAPSVDASPHPTRGAP